MSKRNSDISTDNIIYKKRKIDKHSINEDEDEDEDENTPPLPSCPKGGSGGNLAEITVINSTDEDENSTNTEDINSENSENSEENLEFLKQKDKEAYSNLLLVKYNILSSEPSIINILKEKLLLEDKSLIVQLYEIYKKMEPSTEEWLLMREKINKLLKKNREKYNNYCKYTIEEHNNMEEEITKLTRLHTPNSYKYSILQLQTNLYNKSIIYQKYNELIESEEKNDEYSKLKTWIDWAISIPYDKIKQYPFTDYGTRELTDEICPKGFRCNNNLTTFLLDVRTKLDTELYGMNNIKEQILLFLNSKISNPNMKRCSLGLIGEPGTGKTSIARLIAEVLDYPFQQISLGGISNPDFLKGHEYTYVGSQPGEIVRCLKRMGYKNGILFLDEYEKISDNKSICSALLHITDPVQNSEFRDSYLNELTIDLSNIWFIYSMNNLPDDSALRDRLFTIEVPGYNTKEKIKIVKDYIIPKSLKNINIIKDSINISEENIKYIINKVTSGSSEKGIRTIEKNINDIINKINFIYKHQDENGSLQKFNMSFDFGFKVTYPIEIDKKIIDKLIKDKEINTNLEMLYI